MIASRASATYRRGGDRRRSGAMASDARALAGEPVELMSGLAEPGWASDGS